MRLIRFNPLFLFYNGRQGEAAAVSVIGFLILLVCASVYMIYTLRKGDDY